MFEEITLQNFRTHRSTKIMLGPITLIIGNNSAGKTNFLSGIQHFGRLIARGRPEEGVPRADSKRRLTRVDDRDFFPHRHRLAPDDEPMVFACKWNSPTLGQIEYTMELYPNNDLPRKVGCRERIRICSKSNRERKIEFGYNRGSDAPGLRVYLKESRDLTDDEINLCAVFFQSAASFFTYNFQPVYLKGRGDAEGRPARTPAPENSADGDEAPSRLPDRLVIHSQLGYDGRNLQTILSAVEEKDRRVYDRLIASLRTFDSSFHGFRFDQRRQRLVWQFNLGREGPTSVDEFPTDVVSDGLLRAACIGLLTAMYHPPALIQLEEVENGLNPGNIGGVINWLWQAVGKPDSTDRGYATQFIITSHSPSVLRQFSEHLDYVYHVRLDKRTYGSDVRNLGEALEILAGLGAIPSESIEREGKKVIKLAPNQLTELWYSGTFG